MVSELEREFKITIPDFGFESPEVRVDPTYRELRRRQDRGLNSLMATIKSFGTYLPDRVVLNQEIAAKLNRTPEWILNVSGIEERRYAAPDETWRIWP